MGEERPKKTTSQGSEIHVVAQQLQDRISSVDTLAKSPIKLKEALMPRKNNKPTGASTNV